MVFYVRLGLWLLAVGILTRILRRTAFFILAGLHDFDIAVIGLFGVTATH